MTHSARTLRPGEALPLESIGLAALEEFAITLSVTAGGLPDLVAILVNEAGKVRSDDDLVFYNNVSSSDQAVRYAGQDAGAGWVRITAAHLDADVARVVLGCAGGPLDAPVPVELTLSVRSGAGQLLASAAFSSDASHRAIILFEVYRRAGAWRCRLLAQGYTGGLAALVTEFGVEVDDQGESEPSLEELPHPTAPPAAAGNRNPMPQSYPPPPAPIAGPPPGTSWTGQVLPPSPAAQARLTPPGDTGRRGGLFTSRKRAQLEAQNAELSRLLTATGAMDNVAIAGERDRLLREVADLAAEADRRRADLVGLESRLNQVRAEIAVAEGDAELTEVGIYRYRHRLDDAISYKGSIDSLRDRIKVVAQGGRAVTGNTNWTVNGSLSQGRKMVNEVSKLMLRAYNADADHAVRTMRAYKLDSMLTRLDTTRRTIARLGQTMNIAVTDEYHRLRRQELELTADYLSKLEEEKERQRQLRDEQREQQRAEAEYRREQERLERERSRYAEALTQLEARGDSSKVGELRSRLASVEDALAGLAERRANMRLGHVYVISNIGAFGQRMVKIGMTRRLDPMDRVRELGDASVPFRFDVHALIFSEDAVALETALHQRFAAHRVNRVNTHREFFYITPGEVRTALADLGSQYLLHYTETIEAPEWRQSGGPERALLPT
jgi:stress response protein SCP2/predicted nuclease with TOPRIM domain